MISRLPSCLWRFLVCNILRLHLLLRNLWFFQDSVILRLCNFTVIFLGFWNPMPHSKFYWKSPFAWNESFSSKLAWLALTIVVGFSLNSTSSEIPFSPSSRALYTPFSIASSWNSILFHHNLGPSWYLYIYLCVWLMPVFMSPLIVDFQ